MMVVASSSAMTPYLASIARFAVHQVSDSETSRYSNAADWRGVVHLGRQ